MNKYLAIFLKNVPAMCDVVPFPAEAKLTFPGLAFKYAMSSLMLFTGRLGCTTTMAGIVVNLVIGTKSLMGSNPVLE